MLRGELEYSLAIGSDSEVTHANSERMTQVSSWMCREGLDRSLSRNEKKMLGEPLGTWSRQDILNASWRADSLGAILWALSLVDAMPGYDAECSYAAEIVMRIGLLHPVQGFVGRSSLRSADEIGRARNLAELWHWRSRTTQLLNEPTRLPSDCSPNYLEGIIGQAAEMAHRRGDISAPIDGDFPAFGKPYRDLTANEYSMVTSIAMERHFALNWLSGYSDDWDNTPTDT